MHPLPQSEVRLTNFPVSTHREQISPYLLSTAVSARVRPRGPEDRGSGLEYLHHFSRSPGALHGAGLIKVKFALDQFCGAPMTTRNFVTMANGPGSCLNWRMVRPVRKSELPTA
jgi:hypothetical protein